MERIYFENHAGTKMDPRVFEGMMPYFNDYYGNAQSIHSFGTVSKNALEHAREQVSLLINCSPEEIYFTSCGSESNNLAIKGAVDAYKQKGRHIIMSGIEHFSVLYAGRRLGQAGFEVTFLPVDKYGLVSPEDLRNAIRDDTILVSIQHSNPEIGSIQDIKKLAEIARSRGIIFHTDAVASAGIVAVDVKDLGVDLLSLAGTQYHGPKGAAALYVKKGVRITPQIDGGIQENGRRAGTENIPAIVGFGIASEIAMEELSLNNKKLLSLRNTLIKGISEHIEYAYLNGHIENRLPNNVNYSIEFVEGEGMFLLLDQKGICISSGSSCASKALKMSHVLSAIKVDPAVGQGSVVITLSKYNDIKEVEYFLKEFSGIVGRLRGMSPLYDYYIKNGKRKPAGPGTDYDKHE
ncbi:MAG: Cysteine desulfurase [Elusimicrobia bacterium ADurb.Bin231]|nr:MAG: Cysteine desulfurase [Elusimicrobia bacterium ADurb.Bin231]